MIQIMILSVLLVISQCHLSFAASFHTINDFGDWDYDTESFSATNTNGLSLTPPTWFVTWDSNSRYVALQSDLIIDESVSTFIFLDVDPPQDLSESNRVGIGDSLRYEDGNEFTELPFLADFSIRFSGSSYFTEIISDSEYGKQSPEVSSITKGSVLQVEIKRTGLLSVTDVSFCGYVVTSDGVVTHISTPDEEEGTSVGIRSFLNFKLNSRVIPNSPSHIVYNKELYTRDSNSTSTAEATSGSAIPIQIHSEKKDSTALIVGVVVGIGGFIIVAFTVIAFFLIRRKRVNKVATQGTELAPGPTYVTATASDPLTSRHGNTGEIPMTAIATKPDILCTSVKAVGVSWDQNSLYRKSMEDEHVIMDQYGGELTSGYFAVFDGHGGREVADYAAKHLHTTILSEFARCYEIDNTASTHPTIGAALTQAYLKLEEQMKESGATEAIGNHMPGSTAVTAIIRKKKDGTRWLYVANVGDSRAVLCRGNNAIRLTYDHRATDEAETARIKENAGWIVNKKVAGVLSVTRAFGNAEMKHWILSEPYLTETELTKEDRYLILACDGVWDVMSDQEAADMVNKSGGTAQAMSDMLLKAAMDKRTRDNVTIAVIHL